MPDFVKQATLDEINSDPEDLPAHLYADDRLLLYPCHTKTAAMLSAAQFMEDKDNYSEERQQYIIARFMKHASELNIQREMQEVLSHQPEREPVEYALYSEGRYFFPVRNEKEASAVCDYLVRHWRDIAADTRETAARNTLAIAERHNFPIARVRPILEKIAGYCLIDKDALAYEIKRAAINAPLAKAGAAACESDRAAILIHMLSKVIDDVPFTEQKKLREIQKAASDVLAFLPYENEPIELRTALAQTDVKKVADSIVRLANGKYYKCADFARIPASVLHDWFDGLFDAAVVGDSVVATALAKEASVIDDIEADRFSEMLESLGISPVLVEGRAKEVPC